MHCAEVSSLVNSVPAVQGHACASEAAVGQSNSRESGTFSLSLSLIVGSKWSGPVSDGYWRYNDSKRYAGPHYSGGSSNYIGPAPGPAPDYFIADAVDGTAELTIGYVIEICSFRQVTSRTSSFYLSLIHI